MLTRARPATIRYARHNRAIVFPGRSEGKISEPLQVTTLGEALFKMEPLSKVFPRVVEAFALRRVRPGVER